MPPQRNLEEEYDLVPLLDNEDLEAYPELPAVQYDDAPSTLTRIGDALRTIFFVTVLFIIAWLINFVLPNHDL